MWGIRLDMPDSWASSDAYVHRYDFVSTKTGAIIVPGCGFDSIPADLLVFLSNRTLKNALGPDAQLGLSQTFYSMKGGISGGTLATLMTEAEIVPKYKLLEAQKDYAVSQGTPFGVPLPYSRITPR